MITLTNESCFDLLPRIKDNSVSLVLIDPPYEVSRETNFSSGEAKGKDTDRFRVSMNFGDWDENFTGPDPICHDKDRFHTTQKPLELIMALIKKHSEKGDLICDCFSGSGTTALACLNMGRDFIGCEISEEYYKRSMFRLQCAGAFIG